MDDFTPQYPLLATISSPNDLAGLDNTQLLQLADEARSYLINTLNHCGGHFGSSLGAVELTIALHTVFNTPHDRIIWDVGHQAYVHKMLTGRREQLHTIKQPDGLAPFPKREESEYDSFGVGHSSTSISAALGMALAAQHNHSDTTAIAVIGDGGLTGGMAFEALNHAGATDANLLIILNDNDMSISPNVGALTHYFTRILSGKVYTSLREGSKKVLNKMGPMKELAKRTETHIKGMVTPGTLFEELGINYFGPIDGHDLPVLLTTLRNLQQQKGPRLLHVVTTKGKGYAPAEADPVAFHAVKPGFVDKVNSQTNNKTNESKITTPQLPDKPTYSDIFGYWLTLTALNDQKCIGITPAMREGSGMVQFAAICPDQYIDVGIAEQHSVTLAAGIATEHYKPVVAIYSTFLQRAYDQLIHDVALQNLDVTFALDRAGLVGADGPTHAGSFDHTYLRCIPNMIIMAPSNEHECWQMLNTAYRFDGPAAVRYPRGCGIGKNINENLFETIPLGKAEILREGKQVAILAFGSLVNTALIAGKQLNATVVNMRFVKPLDEQLIRELVTHHDMLVTIEENVVAGGAGSGVNEFLASEGITCPIINLGLPDQFLEHGKPNDMLRDCGLDVDGIVKSVNERLKVLEKAEK